MNHSRLPGNLLVTLRRAGETFFGIALSARLVGLAVLSMMLPAAQANPDWPRMVESHDGVSIAYEVHGSGEPTLVLVHGWSCDGRYWRAQVPHLAEQHRVIVVDLAGHGHSGQARENYTMAAFGEDVRAVVTEVGASQVVLVGHSMGGPVIAEAARLMPEIVIGLVGVDTFQDVAGMMSAEQWDQFLTPLRADFGANAPQFVAGMFAPSTDTDLRDWVVADMSSAPPAVAMSAMEAMARDNVSGHSLEVLQSLDLPLIAINADGWPTDIEGNQKQLPDFRAVIVENADHFLHMALPDIFNHALLDAIAELALAESGSDSQTVPIDGLEWAAATNGDNIKWPEAVEYCTGLTLAGHSDWRLPTLDELESLHDPDADGGEGIRRPFVIEDCCLWSGESLVDRPAEDGDEIGGRPEMYHWGFMFDGGFPYYAVHIFDDGRALCVRDVRASAN